MDPIGKADVDIESTLKTIAHGSDVLPEEGLQHRGSE